MIKKLLSRFLSKGETKKPDVLDRLVTHADSKEGERILRKAGQLANDEQRKIYYGNAQKSEA